MGKRAAITLLLFELLLAPGLIAQIPLTFNVKNKAKIAEIINAQTAACRAAENATSEAELDALDVPLQQMIQGADQRVRQLSADSAPALAAQKALREAEAKLKPLEDRLGPLHARRNEINSAQAPFETQIAAALQGDNPAHQSLNAVNDQIKSLREQIGRDSTALKEFLQKNPDRNWLQRQTGPAYDEQIEAAITKKQGELARLEAHQLTILRSTFSSRFDPEYERLVREERANQEKIDELEQRIAPLKEARDAAKQRLATVDLEGIKNLEQLHEENGFVDQYLHQARDCIAKRRTQLASGAPAAPAAPATPSAPAPQPGLSSVLLNGRWDANCSGDLPPDAARSDGGDMNFYFSDMDESTKSVPVRVTFTTTGKVIGIDYGATGRLLESGAIADGRGGASFYTLVWDGRIEADLARSTGINIGVAVIPDKFKGSGNVTVSDIYRTGGGTCIGTWTAATP